MLTPLAMKLVLHIYTTPADFDVPKTDVRDRTLMELSAEGIIQGDETRPSLWRMTDKGEAFVALALNTPVPVRAWSDPRTNEVIECRSRGF
jgi:hypothetical protein